MDRYPIVTLPKVGRERGKASEGGGTEPDSGEKIAVRNVRFLVFEGFYGGANGVRRSDAEFLQRLGFASISGDSITICSNQSNLLPKSFKGGSGSIYNPVDYIYEFSQDIVTDDANSRNYYVLVYAFKNPVEVPVESVPSTVDINLDFPTQSTANYEGNGSNFDNIRGDILRFKTVGGMLWNFSYKDTIEYFAVDGDAFAMLRGSSFGDADVVMKIKSISNDYHLQNVMKVDSGGLYGDSLIVNLTDCGTKDPRLNYFALHSGIFWTSNIIVKPYSLDFLNYFQAGRNLVTYDFSDVKLNERQINTYYDTQYNKIIVADEAQKATFISLHPTVDQSLITIKQQ